MKEIQKLYLAHIFIGLSNTITVVFTLYLLSYGMSQSQIALLFGFFMIVLALFDIPTGGIADMFGHKFSIVSGLLLQGISCVIFLFFPTFVGFFVGMFVDALGLAFQSGAIPSLCFELLKKEKDQDAFGKIYGRATTFMLIASIIASPLGSFLYVTAKWAPYVFAISTFFTGALIVLSIKWEFVKKTPTLTSYVQTLMEGIYLTVRNSVLIGIVIIGFAMTLARLLLNQNISQPYQVSIGVPVVMIGFVLGGIFMLQSGISFISHRLYRVLGRVGSLLVIVAATSLAMIVMSFTYTLLALPLLFLFYSTLIYRDTIFTFIGQEEVDTSKRSTMASTVSFLTSMFAGIALVFWGKILDAVGIHPTLLFLGIFCLIVGVLGIGIVILPSSRLSQSPAMPK